MLQEKLFQEKGINWNNLPTDEKRGRCIVNGVLDLEIPLFNENRAYIEDHLKKEE